MTTDTFTSGTDDGHILGQSGTYATARSTSTSTDDTSTACNIGQLLNAGTYRVYRAFVAFDTSSIPDGASVSAATLYITAQGDFTITNDFTIKVRRWAWSTALGGGNQEANYDGAPGGTLEGDLQNTASGWSGQYSLAVDPAGINLSGRTSYVMLSDRDESATAPTGNEWVTWRTADHATDADRPKLEVTYTTPAGGTNTLMLMGVGT